MVKGGLRDLFQKESRECFAVGIICGWLCQQRSRLTRLRPQVWFALFGLPRILADAELLRTKVQRLSAHE